MICIWGVRKISSVDFLFSISGLWAELPFWVGPSRKHKAGIFSRRWTHEGISKFMVWGVCLPALSKFVLQLLFEECFCSFPAGQSQTFSAPGCGGRGSKCAAQTELVTRFGDYSSFFLRQFLRVLQFVLSCSGFLSEHFILLAGAKRRGKLNFSVFPPLLSSFPLSLFIIQNYVHFIILLLPS